MKTDDPDSDLRFYAALAAAAAVVNSSLQVEQVLDLILAQVPAVIPADAYSVMLVRGGVDHLVRWCGYEALGPESEITQAMRQIESHPSVHEMIARGESIVVTDMQQSAMWRSTLGRFGHRAYVGAPIHIDGQVEGYINANSSQPGHFTPRDGERLKAFADHAAVALRNARLYEATQRNAAELMERIEERTAELASRTAWSEAILASASDGIVVTDAEGTILQMNPVAAQWLNERLLPEEARRLQAAIESAAQRPAAQPQPLETLGRLDFELRAAPISTDEQPRAAVVVAVHDVTHLRALDRMKTQFITDVSHELRTPVAAIRLYGSLLRRSAPERWEGYLAALDEATQRMTRLIEGIVQIARLEAGHLTLEPTNVNLNALVSTAAESFLPMAEAKGLRMLQRIAPQPIPVVVDPHWMNQAIEHLIENAVLYTPTGEVGVTTTTARVGEASWAICEVVDTGLGIPNDELAHLAERFFRGEEARTRQIPGSGLGLSIARAIVRQHNGRIEAESRVGVGSRFSVWLPLATAAYPT
jgi:signal transduction histidine kinase